jgi:CRP-like cAMP-binding protein
MTYFFSEFKFGINQAVFSQGDPSDFIYIIKEGVFEASRSKAKKVDQKTD